MPEPQLHQRKTINIGDVHNDHKPQQHTKSQRMKPTVSKTHTHTRVPSEASDTEDNKDEEEQIDHRVTVYGNGHADDGQSESVDAAVPVAVPVAEQSPLDKYENKVEELQTVALISTLMFGFSVALWIDFDQQFFDNIKYFGQTILFSIAAICTIISSALSTVLSVFIIISLRRIMFRFGKHADALSLESFKRKSFQLRNNLRMFIYCSFIGFFVSIAIYSNMKWMATENIGNVLVALVFSVIYLMFGAGLVYMICVFRKVEHINEWLKKDYKKPFDERLKEHKER